MKPKKLLVVGDFISGSGLTQFIFNMFPHFDTNKFNIQCVGYGIDPKDKTKKKCEELGWQLDRVIPITKKPLHHIRWWKKFFKENHFDIIYFNYSSSWNYFPIQYAKRYTNAKIVCHSHNSYYSHVFSNRILMSILDGLNNRGKRIFNKDADVKIATSEDSALWMFNTLKDVTVVDNGIELNDFKFDNIARKKLRNKLKISSSEKLIGFAGVLQERKNPIFALQVFAKYLKKEPNSTLLIIGKGPLKDRINQLVSILGIEEKVKFISYTSNLNKLYSAMDILIFPSLYEGFGLVPLEAQVSNLLVLASNKVAPQVFVTENIKKIDNFDKKNWVQILEKSKCKTNNERAILNSLLYKFDVEKQAAQISSLLESES